MRTFQSRRSGAAPARTLVVVVLFAIVVSLVAFLINRPAGKVPRAAIPTGSVELARTNLVLEDGRLRPAGMTNPFTGFMVEHFSTGSLRSRSAVSNGLLHGVSEGWFTNAQLQVSEHFKEGVSHGLRTKWYSNGTKQSEAGIADGKLHGTFRQWHENGMLSEQVEFIADRPEGLSVAYYPSGFLKARVTMRDGKPTEQTFWKDGEKKE